MTTKNPFKVMALRYARSLQVLVRTAIMWSVDHRAVGAPLQQSFDTLIPLLKQTGQFTLGFVDQRIMLNKILTTDGGLSQLENEFLKRGIGAVTFEAGITLARYKRAIAVLVTPAKLIDRQGGARPFLEQNPLENVHVIPASKNQARTEDGDVALDSDSESYLRSKQLERSGMGGAGIGLGDLELLLRDLGAVGERGGDVSPQHRLSMIERSVEAALTDERYNPRDSYIALARALQEFRPDFVLSLFPSDRQPLVRSIPSEQVAAEFIEDTALNWATNRLASAPTGPEAIIVQEEVVRVLLRSLQATQMAGRLALKLADHIKEHALPKHLYDRIQGELKWVALPPAAKQAQLLVQRRFDAVEFRRLMQHVRDQLAQGQIEQTTALAIKYFDLLDGKASDISPEELSRATDLIRAMAGASFEFIRETASRLAKALRRADYNEFLHYQVANCLAVLSKSAATYEDFDTVQAVGSALQHSAEANPSRHKNCCSVVHNLLPQSSIERIVEISLQRREDSAWTKTAATLLRWTGSDAVEKVLQRLEVEPGAINRLALVRLCVQIGEVSLEAVHRRLTNERWYVVRNACNLLGKLKDPELLQRLAPILQHADARVQEAAVAVLVKSRAARRAEVLAEALPQLNGNSLQRAINELVLLKDPSTLPKLGAFIFSDSHRDTKKIRRAIEVLGAIPAEGALELLATVLSDTTMDSHTRALALSMLRLDRSGIGQRLVQQFLARFPEDPLAAECKRARGAAASGQT